MTTHGSSPRTHAWCPGAMAPKSPRPYSISSPVIHDQLHRPGDDVAHMVSLTAVRFAMGLTCSDHSQPG